MRREIQDRVKTVIVLGLIGIFCGALLVAIFGANLVAQSGSALIVNSVASPLTASIGNNSIVSIYVSVQSSSGLIDSLSDENFDIFALQLPSSACRVGSSVASNLRPGSYRIDVIPAISGCTWERGEYVFTVVVTAGSQSGADIASVKFD
jgi:hypothetical protein